LTQIIEVLATFVGALVTSGVSEGVGVGVDEELARMNASA